MTTETTQEAWPIEVTPGMLTEALTEFYLVVRSGSGRQKSQVADPAEVADALHATLSRIAAERGPVRVSEQWAVAYGSDDLNDGKGYVWPYDDEEDARAHVHLTGGACVARRTVLVLPWEAVPAAAEAEAAR